MKRAYSTLEIKAVSEDGLSIEGIASTPTADRMGDIVDPMGAKFAVPLPLLWQHDSHAPIGEVSFAKPTPKGIPFKARLVDPADVESPTLKDRLQEAADSIRTGLVRAVSIGFRDLAHEVMKDGGWKFTDWEWLELSAVTIPANAEALITTIRSIDAEARAAAGVQDEVSDEAHAEPGAKGHVVKLQPGPPEAEPFVIKKIRHLA